MCTCGRIRTGSTWKCGIMARALHPRRLPAPRRPKPASISACGGCASGCTWWGASCVWKVLPTWEPRFMCGCRRMSEPIRVVLADDHELVLEGLRARLERVPEMRVVAAVTDGRVLVEHLETWRPDVLVLDLHMGEMDGYRVLQVIRERGLGVRVLVLTALSDVESWHRALELGAHGIALKTGAPRQVVEAIRQVAAGNVVFPQALQARLLQREASAADTLTEREREVWALIAEGLTTQEIARRLHLSENTVKFHCKNLYGKLGVSNRAEATRAWMQAHPED
ncbi:MAG: DNA-binding response regulator [Caldilineae bacterium]|nr:MAG: DNA-binding response regulator [Caldilineae bacterium]